MLRQHNHSAVDPMEDERRRVQCLHTLQILDSPPDPALDALTRALALQFDSPISLVSLLDDRRQWFKSRHGLTQTETPREWSFCAHAIAAGGLLEIADASMDPRFQGNPLVTGAPHIRFYAGAPVVVSGHAIGALCVIDRKPRSLSAAERQTLVELALVAQICIERSVAQQRLELGRVRQDDMLRAASDFIWETDAERRFVWLSEGVERTLGVAASALVGQPIWNPPLLDTLGEPLPDHLRLHEGLRHGGLPSRVMVELPSIAAGGVRTAVLLLSAVAVRNADGGVTGWRGTAQDMTTLLEASRRSQELEVRLSSIASQLPGVIFMVERRPCGELCLPYASEGLLRVFGRRADEVGGDVMALFANVPAVQRRTLLADLHRSRRTGLAWTFECCLQNPLGEDRWIGGRATPRTGADGRTVWYGYAADFTVRRAASTAMAAAQRRLQHALDVGHLGVLNIDHSAGTVEWDANARRIHGSVVGKNASLFESLTLNDWLERLDASERARVRSLLAQADAAPHGTPNRLAYTVQRGGAVAQVELRVERAEAGPRLVGLCRDMTEQQRAEHALHAQVKHEAARESQTEFLSRLSHELRTPMNAILGFVDLMRSDTLSPLSAQQLQWSQHVASAGEQLMALINDLLDLTRIEAGHHAMQPVALCAGRMLRDCQALLTPIAARQGNVLAAPTGETHLRVRADRRALSQVLLNLVGNAIKFDPAGGQVDCHVEQRGDRAMINICDRGPGVPLECRGRLFQPFDRLAQEHGNIEGSGLGLAITRRLVEAMQGSISAKFPADGGTCMRIELPVADAGDVGFGPDIGLDIDIDSGSLVCDSPPPQPEASAALSVRRAVYAEDNPVNAMLLQAMFGMRSDWKLDVVGCARSLRSALRRTAYDLVILDINLGNDSGLDIVRELRADPRSARLLCVALSANGLADQIAAALQAGFDAYWTKPVDLAELHRRLDTLPRSP